ncbi:hypothetical protein [Microbulbifer agarilyticus]
MDKREKSKAIPETEIPRVGMVQPGKSLEHPLFGVGTVLEIAQWDSGDITINVDFQEHGSKWLVPALANLAEPSTKGGQGGFLSRLFGKRH